LDSFRSDFDTNPFGAKAIYAVETIGRRVNTLTPANTHTNTHTQRNQVKMCAVNM